MPKMQWEMPPACPCHACCRFRAETSDPRLFIYEPLRRRCGPVDTAVGRRRVLVAMKARHFRREPPSFRPPGVPTSLRVRCTCPGLKGFWWRSVSDLCAAARGESMGFIFKDTEPSPAQDSSGVRQQGDLLGPPPRSHDVPQWAVRTGHRFLVAPRTIATRARCVC